jgi:hypothetical protein
MTSKLFISIGLAIWASIGVFGYFVLKLLWDLDISAHPAHGFVIVILGLLWLCWLIGGGILGVAFVAAGLDD